ncbi:hypothetical protein L596_028437 [Steinernema carpocapsae]|uniref:Uncharacterized protein n=1 Tax=Steinernema carpocapsae TaxID=34508 RepID=A0A4U5LYG4_STECR|nr:hypothetical protein L596_028437 [Steinernema carpocapsae]
MALTEGSLEKECLREKLEKEKRHIEDLKADNQQIADTLRDKRQNNEKMRQFLEEKDEELAQQEEESKSLREKLNHAENDLNKAKELTRDLQNKSQSLENELHSKESLIEVLRKELEAERQRHVKESLELREELETERHMYSQELSELRNQRLEMEERLRTKKDQFPIQGMPNVTPRRGLNSEDQRILTPKPLRREYEFRRQLIEISSTLHGIWTDGSLWF